MSLQQINNILDKYWNHNEAMPIIQEKKGKIKLVGHAASLAHAEVVINEKKIPYTRLVRACLTKDHRRFIIID